MSPLVTVENLVKIFKIAQGGAVRALDGVCLEVEEGEILGIIGESGSGKTTLLRILRGVEKFDEGLVRIVGVELKPSSNVEDFHKVRRITAIHLQRTFGLWSEPVVNNVIRALKYVEEGDERLPLEETSEYLEYRERAMELLRLVGLEHRADLWADVLSGGEKQRLILARQLAKKPKLLLLDEPATMTCPITRKELLDAVKRANEELGLTTIVVSHMPEIHRSLAHRMVWLDQGKVKMEGDVEKILESFMARVEPPLPLKKLPRRKAKIAELRNVTKRYFLVGYGHVFSLKEATMPIWRGEILAIIGPSGAGKTVLVRILTGLELPDSGEVVVRVDRRWVNIAELGPKSMKARSRIGILHQEFALPYWARVVDLFAGRMGLKSSQVIEEALKKASIREMDLKLLDAIHRIAELPWEEAKCKLEELGFSPSVIEELFPALPTRVVEEKVKDLLKTLNLTREHLYRRVHELSGGEQVRVAIGLALSSKPEILVLDEPFGDLDPVNLRRVANALKRINELFNTTMVLISHQLDFVEEIAHRAVLIEDGELVFSGSPREAVTKFFSYHK